ncbi:ribonuclease M5 [Vagococcus sp. BWB3-3]|uniref:Ribonuclease M5 n=1 Tax=Vagococcus allomyrinae TaxID=2794353 RepID=A0A940PFE7_9ENTE|nr:ribonuclease M5 [Vagococcus allomyrinae]MBP1042978.1 ribonuclease M5 [Vagococcus allomyrinae]
MEDKLKIQEIIVVEGKDDTKRIQEVVEADTIETIGSAINEEILERIAHAQDVRGVIVFTDPDFSGEKIRKIITEAIPNVKHAFISRRLATPSKRGASLGVEHASDEAIIEALKNVMTPQADGQTAEIPQELLIHYGLIAGPKAKARREALGDLLRIGYTNGKQLRKRLKMFQLSEAELVAAMETVLKGEMDGV